MKKSFVLACLVSGIALSMSACDEGAYNNLQCDDSYVAECLDNSHYMVCEGGMLVVKECAAAQYCHVGMTTDAEGNTTSGAASCVSAGQPATCDCATGANCSDAEKAACQKPACDCTTGTNCTADELAACQKPACDCTTGENCTADELAACQKPACDCTTGSNCSDDELAACQKPACDCTTGENCTDAEKAECSKPACDCTTGENCTEEEKAECSKTDDCTSVCGENNALTITCGEDVTEVTCAVACDTDKNECKPMTIDNLGKDCDDTYKDVCAGPLLGYCREGKIVAAYCSDDTSCQISETLGVGDCVTECETPHATKTECVYYEMYNVWARTNVTCETINDKNYQFEDIVEYCYTGCNDNNSGCKLENENDPCTGEEPDACAEDGSYTIYCYEDEDDPTENFMSGDVCPQNTKCMINSDAVADCYEPCTEAEVGTTVSFCGTKEETLWGIFLIEVPAVRSKVCTDIGNGQFAYIQSEAAEDIEECEHACDAQTNSCVVYDETEGDTCDETYEDACKGDIALSCYIDEDETEGTVYAESCKKDYGENFKCMMIDDPDYGSLPTCVEECTEENATRTTCVDDLTGSAVVNQTCTNGMWVSGDVVYECNNYCSEDATDCEKVVKEEYTRCDPETFTEKCSENGAAVFCDKNGMVAALDCAEYDQMCITEDNYADCYNLCVTEGKVTSVCDDMYEETTTYECTLLDNGMLIDVPVDNVECKKGCNDNLDACAK